MLACDSCELLDQIPSRRPGAVEAALLRPQHRHALACLRFCGDLASEELPEAGLQTARRLLKQALRCQRRSRRRQPEALEDMLEGALRALGESLFRPEESAEVAALRHWVEREMEAAARARQNAPTRFPLLLQALAQGDFELGADSCLEPLTEGGGQFGGLAAIELEILLDVGGNPICTRIAIAINRGLWRWSVQAEGSVSFDGRKGLPLPAADALVPVVLAGLSLQGGRAATLWAQAVRGTSVIDLN